MANGAGTRESDGLEYRRDRLSQGYATSTEEYRG